MKSRRKSHHLCTRRSVQPFLAKRLIGLDAVASFHPFSFPCLLDFLSAPFPDTWHLPALRHRSRARLSSRVCDFPPTGVLMDDNSGGELAICCSPGAARGEASPGGGPTQQTPRRRRLMDGDEKGSEEGVKEVGVGGGMFKQKKSGEFTRSPFSSPPILVHHISCGS